MKQKISVTIDDETRKKIDKIIKTGLFRNVSHAVEFSLNKTIENSHPILIELNEKTSRDLVFGKENDKNTL